MKNLSPLIPILIMAVLSLACSLTTQSQPVNLPTPKPIPATPEPPSRPTPPAELTDPVSSIQVYLVALEDDGASGEKIGCGDSLVPISLMIEPTNGALRASLVHLLAFQDPSHGESGLYNALYQSDLKVESIQVENGAAKVYLTGSLKSGGVCDDPRIIGQLQATALQFSTVQEVHFFVNTRPIEELLSGK
ncbi:MAG: GerMN domain-containing protein [Anaerolineaceae bacterium]